MIGLVLVGLLAATGFLLVKVVGGVALLLQRRRGGREAGRARRPALPHPGHLRRHAAEQGDGSIAFDIAFNGVPWTSSTPVPSPPLFKPGNPVVLEGRWSPDGSTFLSDRIEVKHGEEYREENPDRVPADRRRERRARARRGAPRLRQRARRHRPRRLRPDHRAAAAARAGHPVRRLRGRRRGARLRGDGAGLITRDFSMEYVAAARQQPHPACSTSPPCGRPSKGRSCCGG